MPRESVACSEVTVSKSPVISASAVTSSSDVMVFFHVFGVQGQFGGERGAVVGVAFEGNPEFGAGARRRNAIV